VDAHAILRAAAESDAAGRARARARAGSPGPEAGPSGADGRARYLREEVRGARGVALEGGTQHLLRRRARRAAPEPQLAAARRRDPLARNLL